MDMLNDAFIKVRASYVDSINESEIIKKSKQNGSRKINGSQRAQLKKRIKKPKWTPNNPQFEIVDK